MRTPFKPRFHLEMMFCGQAVDDASETLVTIES